MASISTPHLEGALTLPYDTNRYGPWAGAFLCADEGAHTIFSVTTNGIITGYDLGINADCFHLVPSAQHLYCIDFHQDQSMLLRLPKEVFVNYVGDILAVQAGENVDAPLLFIIHWNGCSFETHSIGLIPFFGNGFFEKAAFAPIYTPPIQ